MNKKIKMIELLNMIARGEELPKSIKYYGFIWQLHNGNYFENGQRMLEDYLANGIVESLNDEVEILEDNTEEIEELYIDTHKILSYDREESKGATVTCFKLIIDEINRLKVAINQLRKDKSND